MKVTKRQLKRIIKKEKAQLLREQYGGPGRTGLRSPQDLRGEIRDEEYRLAREAQLILGDGIELPSEDSVWDDPDRFSDQLMNVWEKLEAVSLALDAYKKAGGY